MYIEPNTNIKILHNCPLEPTYEHTIYFENTEAQARYFNGLTKYDLSRQSYQRVRRGVMRVEITADDLYDCNYLMFRNSSFGRKFFYAFITKVEYVNNITSEITYEMDVLQTWWKDFVFKPCFVERNHTARDDIGGNLLPEDVYIGDYTGGNLTVPSDENGLPYMRDWVIVLVKTANVIGVPATGGFYGRTFHQCEFEIYEPTAQGIADLHTKIVALSIFDNTNVVLALYMMPRQMVYTKAGALGDVDVKTFNAKFAKNYESLGGYVPKNKKLFTYPYNFLRITNMQGITNDYRYEFFSGEDCEFLVGADTTVEPTVVIMPDHYNGLNTTDPNVRLTLGGFPQGTFVTNDFMAKVVQGMIKTALVVGTGNAEALAAGYTKTNTVQERSSKTNRLVTTSVTTEEYQPNAQSDDSTESRVARNLVPSLLNPHVSHVSGDSSALYNLGYFDFCVRPMYVRPEIARCIDDYFSMFGYKINRVMSPMVANRPHWTYIKTANCEILGNVPADDVKRICAIHNKGITYWRHGDEVGNYGLDNSPTIGGN